MNMIQKVKQSKLAFGKAFKMEVPRWPTADAMDMMLALTVI